MVIATRLSYAKYDLNDRSRAGKLKRCQCEGHFNTFVIASGNFIRQTCWAELNQLQLEMTNVLLIVRLDVALAAIETLKLTLNQHVGRWLVKWVDLLAISIFGIKKCLVVVTSHNDRYSFCINLHSGRPSALTLKVTGTQQAPRSANLQLCVRVGRPVSRHLMRPSQYSGCRLWCATETMRNSLSLALYTTLKGKPFRRRLRVLLAEGVPPPGFATALATAAMTASRNLMPKPSRACE